MSSLRKSYIDINATKFVILNSIIPIQDVMSCMSWLFGG